MIYFSHKKAFIACSFVAAAMLFSACGDSSATSQNPGSSKIVEGSVSGASQKGPFQKGSTVTLFELDDSLNQTGHHYETVIDNNSGKYNFDSVSIKGPYAWMVVTGNYLNEYTGKISKRKITLNGLVDLGDGKNININILSHLAFNRIYNLVQQGISVEKAQKQAEMEVLKAFNFEEDNTPFEKMDIFSDGEGDAKLLAISLIMLYEQDVAELKDVILEKACEEYGDCDGSFVTDFGVADDGGKVIETIADIAYDLESDGTWDNDSLKNKIIQYISYNGKHGYFASIRRNLKSIGAAKIPNFEKYLRKFAASEDTLWGTCESEGIVKNINPEYPTQGKKICKSGQWKNYDGPRKAGEQPIDTTGKYNTFVDQRDGHIYKTLDIDYGNGEKATWMASLMEYEAPKTSDKHVSHNPGIGRTYTIQQILNQPETADTTELYELLRSGNRIQGICPEGWHIPNKDDWDKLETYVEKNYQIKELLVYPQYIEKDVGITEGHRMSIEYYNAFNSYYSIEEDSTEFVPFSHRVFTDIWSGGPHSLRCVKD